MTQEAERRTILPTGALHIAIIVLAVATGFIHLDRAIMIGSILPGGPFRNTSGIVGGSFFVGLPGDGSGVAVCCGGGGGGGSGGPAHPVAGNGFGSNQSGRSDPALPSIGGNPPNSPPNGGFGSNQSGAGPVPIPTGSTLPSTPPSLGPTHPTTDSFGGDSGPVLSVGPRPVPSVSPLRPGGGFFPAPPMPAGGLSISFLIPLPLSVLFYLNFVGYILLAAAFYLPSLPQFRPLLHYQGTIRRMLIVYTTLTIALWFIITHAHFDPIAYIDKPIEVALIILLLIDGHQASQQARLLKG